VDSAQYLSHVEADGKAFAAAIAATPPETPVPWCPDWDVAALTKHLTRVHLWVEAVVRTRAQERVDHRELPRAETFEAGLECLLDTLRSVADDEPVWNWSSSSPHVASFWPRRMAHETAMHRWDAQAAGRAAEAIDGPLAADGIDEFLDVFLRARAADDPTVGLPGSLHLHSTDEPGEWTVTVGGGTADVQRGHAKGDAAVKGPASELLRFVGNRPCDVEVFGDQAVVDAWRNDVKF
jgi:uncharacterized protein (TIGR03083 family)